MIIRYTGTMVHQMPTSQPIHLMEIRLMVRMETQSGTRKATGWEIMNRQRETTSILMQMTMMEMISSETDIQRSRCCCQSKELLAHYRKKDNSEKKEMRKLNNRKFTHKSLTETIMQSFKL